MIVRFSKCDFWIPEQICDFHIFFFDKKINFLETKIFFGRSRKNIFSDVFRKPHIFIEKSILKNRKFRFFFAKIFRFFRKCIIDFSMKIFGFRKYLKKYFFEIFRKIFWSREKIFFSRTKYIKIGNLLRNPKITLRKPYDHLKYTKT